MVNRNLVVRIPDQMDGRSKLIFLTQKGKVLQREMVEAAGKVYLQAMANINAMELANCLRALIKIKNNLQ